MKKPEDNKRTSKNLPVILITLFMLAGCGKAGENNENDGYLAAGNPAGDGAAKTAIEEGRPVTAGEAILVRGNNWIYGIPGFKDNGFHALTGEYRFQTAGAGEERILVYLCSEHLYFSEEWQPRRGMGNIQASQRSAGEGFLICVMLDDGKGVLWNAIFQLPFKLEEKASGNDALNQFLTAWSNRFLYFLSMTKTQGDISIPAVVEF